MKLLLAILPFMLLSCDQTPATGQQYENVIEVSFHNRDKGDVDIQLKKDQWVTVCTLKNLEPGNHTAEIPFVPGLYRITSFNDTSSIYVIKPDQTTINVYQQNGNFIFDVESLVTQQMICNYFDAIGQMLQSQRYELQNGFNRLYMNDNTTGHGVYILWFKTDDNVIVKKIIR